MTTEKPPHGIYALVAQRYEGKMHFYVSYFAQMQGADKDHSKHSSEPFDASWLPLSALPKPEGEK